MEIFKILFICKYNRFRSKIAEAYFNKINKNKKIKARSAGLIQGDPTPRNTIKIAKNLGINVKGTPRTTSTRLLSAQDLVVIVANNVPKKIFKDDAKKIIVWKIPDAKATDNKNIIKSIKLVMNEVKKLNKPLEKKWK